MCNLRFRGLGAVVELALLPFMRRRLLPERTKDRVFLLQIARQPGCRAALGCDGSINEQAGRTNVVKAVAS